MNPGVWAPVQQRRPTPSPGIQGLQAGDRGPDVSSHQGSSTNWTTVSQAGFRFAFVKATESVDYVNPYFRADWEALGDPAIWMVRGAYHFARPSQNQPEDEADFFIRTAVPLRAEDLLVLDMEDEKVAAHTSLAEWCVKFSDRIFSRIAVTPLFYGGGPYMKDHGLDNTAVAAHYMGLWIAAYQANPPAVPNGWGSLLFWQFTSEFEMPGVNGPCDCSIYLP